MVKWESFQWLQFCKTKKEGKTKTSEHKETKWGLHISFISKKQKHWAMEAKGYTIKEDFNSNHPNQR